jgi:phage tail-like protein
LNHLSLTPQERVSHVADFCRRYPGETVTFYTRVELDRADMSFSLQIDLPAGICLESSRSSLPGFSPIIAQGEAMVYLIWQVEGTLPDRRIDFEVSGIIDPVQEDRTLECRALLTLDGSEEPYTLEETACVLVPAKGRYLKHLPSIYQEDQLMGRFLMLFESILDPLEKKIHNQADYLDPGLAPAQFLPWLGSWTDLPADPDLGEEAQRSLVSKASRLVHERGTRSGLQTYLEAYTGGHVRIVEHFSDNFRLGPDARLGLGIALGVDNIPNTFSVSIRIDNIPVDPDEEAARRRRHALERKIHGIIEAEKPVHTGYTLHLELESARENEGSR